LSDTLNILSTPITARATVAIVKNDFILLSAKSRSCGEYLHEHQ
jgi:hypothetical protein